MFKEIASVKVNLLIVNFLLYNKNLVLNSCLGLLIPHDNVFIKNIQQGY